MRLLNNRLPAFFLSVAFLTVPTLSCAHPIDATPDPDPTMKTSLSVTNKVEGFKVLVSAEMMCEGTFASSQKRKPFPYNPVMPADLPIVGEWPDCLLMPAEFYELNHYARWGNLTIRVKDLQTDDFIVVHLPTLSSDRTGEQATRVVQFNGRSFHFELYHSAWSSRSGHSRVNAQLTIHE